MAKRRLFVGIGIPLLAMASFVLLLAVFPAPSNNSLPQWISQVKPFEMHAGSLTSVSLYGKVPTGALLVRQETRVIPIDFAKFSKRLKDDLSGQKEWRLAGKNTKFPYWTRNSPSDILNIWFWQSGEHVIVASNWIREPTWAEKAQHKIQNLFRARK